MNNQLGYLITCYWCIVNCQLLLIGSTNQLYQTVSIISVNHFNINDHNNSLWMNNRLGYLITCYLCIVNCYLLLIGSSNQLYRTVLII